MATLAALQAAVRAQPDDWQRWLVLADWLSDNGDVRGQLIVLEHRLAEALSEEEGALQQQVDALQEGHQAEWLSGLAVPEKTRLQWRHGFVVGVWLPWNDGTLMFLDALRTHPVGGLLTTLDLGLNNIRDDDAHALAASQVLSSLTTLDLESNHISADGARALAASQALHSLIELDLEDNHIGDDGVRALAASEWLRGRVRT